MLSQEKKGTRTKKKGISIMIGYILLISLAVVMSVVVYRWLKTYVPADTLECADGVSMIITSYTYDCPAKTLSITLKNNGRFSIGGFFIHGSTDITEEIATIDLSQKLLDPEGNHILGNSVVFLSGTNVMTPDDAEGANRKTVTFVSVGNSLKKIELLPLRFEDKKPVSCGDAKIEEKIACT